MEFLVMPEDKILMAEWSLTEYLVVTEPATLHFDSYLD